MPTFIDNPLAAGLAEDSERAEQIRDRCTRAGAPKLAGGFILDGTSVADVELLLIEGMAAARPATSQRPTRPAWRNSDNTHPTAIQRLCGEAGYPGLAEQFIAEGLNVGQVECELLGRMAARREALAA